MTRHKAGASKLRRSKLKAHDQGHDRHNKGIAYNNKRLRLEALYKRVLSSKKRKRKPRPVEDPPSG